MGRATGLFSFCDYIIVEIMSSHLCSQQVLVQHNCRYLSYVVSAGFPIVVPLLPLRSFEVYSTDLKSH
jgi:hypothetical protein